MQPYDSQYFMTTSVSILENEHLREPQRQAYYKSYKHFITDRNESHAIIILPTGVGKTGVMGLLPFMVAEGRVLIITPQLTVKDTVIDSLNTDDSKNFWSERHVIEDSGALPVIIEYEGIDTTNELLYCTNIVILNVHKLQGRLDSSLIHRVGSDFFDMIIIDEAHHSTANTWVETLNYFSDAKVVKLTGTPVRSDGEEMSGKLIYHYKLSQAMANKYVKSLTNNEFVPDEVRFTLDGDTSKQYDEQAILTLKDEDWISRTVAYSENCSLQVVKESIRILNEKKSCSSIPHKIIAVACSISHAERIKELYSNQGVRTSIIHSDMNFNEIDSIKKDIENDRVDVVVNVNMLGEGYDHPCLSIAAIFRPFRSELPYAQFIGRILRYIQNTDQLEDNIACVVSHKLLFLEKLWQKYKVEIDESEVIKSLTVQNILQCTPENIGGDGEVLEIDVGQAYSEGGTVVEDAYMETEILKKYKAESEEINKQIKGLVDLLNIDEAEAKRIIQSQRAKEKRYTRPDLVYKQGRKDIDVRIKEEIVPELCVKCIPPHLMGRTSLSRCRLFFPTTYAWIPQKTEKEDGCLAIYFNHYLNQELGKKRPEWEISDYERANRLLDKQIEYVESILKDFYANQ